MKFASIMVVVLLIIGGGTYWLLMSSQDEHIPEEVITEDIAQEIVFEESEPDEVKTVAEVEPAPVEPDPDPVPILNESTEWVMNRARPILTHPIFKGFFKQKEMIRKLVVVVDRMSRGENPYRHISFLCPSGQFEVDAQEDIILLSPENSRRTTALIEALDALPTGKLLSIYQKAAPLFEEAYAELGNVDQWSDAVDRVFAEIEGFSYPEGPLELIGRKGIYIFKDTNLEGKSPLQKALIRMGPAHANKLKRLAATYHRLWR